MSSAAARSHALPPRAPRRLALGALSLLAAISVVSAAGCSRCRTACCLHTIDGELSERMQAGMAPDSSANLVLPNGADWTDGLSEDEAVVIGLWNNGAFREAIVELNLAHADLVQAGLLPNPEFIYFFPASNKPLKWAVEFPIEALWLRPIRIAVAQRENERVCRRLTQLGLDLIRDVRLAHSELALAHGRYRVAEEAVKLRDELAALARARLDAGDISVQESVTAKIDALTARQDLTRLGYDRDWAEERLRNLMGIGLVREPIEPVVEAAPTAPPADVDFLVTQALEDRPDMQAATAAVAAADERLRLVRRSWFRFLGIADATSGRASGHEFSPAFRLTVPLFNLNQGAIARAEAERDQAVRRRTTLHDQIIMDTRQSHVRYRQAADEWRVLDTDVRPEVEGAIRRAEAAYREGETSYTVALETTRQLIDSRMREQQLLADLRRSRAELERNVGRRLDQYESLPDAEAVVPPEADALPEALPEAGAQEAALPESGVPEGVPLETVPPAGAVRDEINVTTEETPLEPETMK